LHQRIGRIAPGELRPYEDHRGARGRTQQDQPGDVLLGIGRRDQVGKDDLEEQHAKCSHRERLDEPVHYQRDDQALWLVTDATHRAEIDRHHHREYHRPDQYCDDKIDRGVFDAR